jgi:hypothetical protein
MTRRLSTDVRKSSLKKSVRVLFHPSFGFLNRKCLMGIVLRGKQGKASLYGQIGTEG